MNARAQARLAEIRAIEVKATKGPWEYDEMHQEIHTPLSDSYWLIVSEARSTPDQAYTQDQFGHQYDANFDLIAKSRNALRALLAIAEAAISGDPARIAAAVRAFGEGA